MDMRERIPINATLDPTVVAELDEWLSKKPIRTSRAAYIEYAVKKVMAEEKSKARRSTK